MPSPSIISSSPSPSPSSSLTSRYAAYYSDYYSAYYSFQLTKVFKDIIHKEDEAIPK